MSPKTPQDGGPIRAAYVRAGMNRSQFQRAIGVAYSTILNWERGRTRPNAHHLQLISQVTGTPVSRLLGTVERTAEPAEPPSYPSLGQFLASPLGARLTDSERRTLEGIVFHGIVPSVATFHAIVVGMRMGTGDLGPTDEASDGRKKGGPRRGAKGKSSKGSRRRR